MVWERCAETIRDMGGEVLLGRRVVGCSFNSSTRRWTVEARASSGEVEQYEAEHLVSSMPIRER